MAPPNLRPAISRADHDQHFCRHAAGPGLERLLADRRSGLERDHHHGEPGRRATGRAGARHRRPRPRHARRVGGLSPHDRSPRHARARRHRSAPSAPPGRTVVEIYDVGTLTARRHLRDPDRRDAGGEHQHPDARRRASRSSRAFCRCRARRPARINASETGTLSATLTSATPPNLLVGLGLGIPRADGGGCYLTTAVNTLTSAAVQVASAGGSRASTASSSTTSARSRAT